MHDYLPRKQEELLRNALERAPVIAILGPRQCGKSTMAKQSLKHYNSIYLDLQNREHNARLSEPELFFDLHRDKLICLDEIQLVPDFFAVMRSEIDMDRRPGRFLILGSASQDLIRQSSETLAGRIEYIELSPFQIDEINAETNWQKLWERGGFPDSLLALNDEASHAWRTNFVTTFLNRDIPSFGYNIPSQTMEKLWRLLAHYHGQTVNYSKLAAILDISIPSLKKYLYLLEKTFMVRLLQPYSQNIKKRMVKSPKVYLRDTGLLHTFLAIDNYEQLLGSPYIGSSWEQFCIEHVIQKHPGWEPYYARTANGAEVDLLIKRGEQMIFFEFKCSKAPTLKRGFTELKELFKPDKSFVLAPVDEQYQIRKDVMVCSPEEYVSM